MDRQNLIIQQQVDHWLALEKQGLTHEQALALGHWLDADRKHLLAYQESQQVEQLLSQLSKQDIQCLEQTTSRPNQSTRHSGKSPWTMAACLALICVCMFGYLNWPTSLNSASFQASYQTKRGEITDIELPDQSKLTLDAKASISVNFDSEKRMNKLLKGRVLFDVASDKARPFVIGTGNSKITVLGTRFSVDKKSHSTRVMVEHGRVSIQNQHERIELSKGDVATIYASGIVISKFDPEITLVDAFKRGRLMFDNTPLNEALETFNRYHDFSYTLATKSHDELTISGTFLVSELENFVTLLPHALPVEVKNLNNHLIISKRN
ncbi:FecR family protein [Pseudoalteromonas atlantica]|uniref:FecR family protein n=1 Tax=Pseudoalteromonas atlantica TaxID=288 RepID=UPI0037361002